MSIPLVLLAAGLGRRFGGPKQLEGVGPSGEPLFALTAIAALDAGLSSVVVVTRAKLRERIDEEVDRWLAGRDVAVALQDAAAPSRTRPWGTAHAVIAGAPADTAVVVANADDWYGADAIAALGERVAAGLGDDSAVVMGYRLGDTLSPHGAVNRAVVELAADGTVAAMAEVFGLERRAGVVVDRDGTEHAEDALVSMNLMALGAGVVDRLRSRFERFADAHADDDTEMVLPDELGALLAAGAIDVECLSTAARWAGMTHRSDLDAVRRAVAADLSSGAARSRSDAHRE